MSAFHITGGKIIDPNGNGYRPAGPNIYWLTHANAPNFTDTMAQLCPTSACVKLLADFPGLNFVRVVWETGYSLAGLEPYITWLTNLGIVVSICDFNISPGQPPASGQALTNQLNWYASVAQTYANNPYVWIEAQNEMYGPGAVMAANHKALYDRVRAVAPDKIVVLGFPGGGNVGTVGTSGQVNGSYMTPAVYAGMRNIVWDLHIYPYAIKKVLGFDSTNIAQIQEFIRGSVAGAYGVRAAQTLTSLDGVVPVIIGEFGNSTSGSAADANGVQLVEAVGTMPVADIAGFSIFAVGTANIGVTFYNALTDTGSNLTNPYGLQGQRLVSAAIKSIPGVPVTPPPPTFTESTNNTVIAVSTDPAIVGSTGEKWTLTIGGQIALNGVADPTTHNVLSLAYVNHQIWQQNASHLWWAKTRSTDGWSPPTGTATSPLPVVIPPTTPSPEGSKVLAPSTDVLRYDNSYWTISGGKVYRDGANPLSTANVVQIEIFGGTIWHKNTYGEWYRWPTSVNWILEPMAIPAS